MKIYFCHGCREIHFDNDYSEANGDLIIEHWESFLKKIDEIKLRIKNGKG